MRPINEFSLKTQKRMHQHTLIAKWTNFELNELINIQIIINRDSNRINMMKTINK
jgi:hypothetical protein